MKYDFHLRYTCVKCGSREYEVDEIRTTGGVFAKIFDVQNKKFSVVSCKQCHYSELYKADTSTLGNIFDFFTN
jgi:predicted nucleic-acid-binding Zn-ribbon protein